tara:strand:+ start:368 stop:604 length:237 start_codon:yes stop_codon:yes gene_type:complete
MAELTEQQTHLQQVLEQQNTIQNEVAQLSNALDSKKAMFTKLQGVREYLEQTGVTLPEETEETVAPVEPTVVEPETEG